MTTSDDKEGRNLPDSKGARRYRPDHRAVPLVNDEGEPMTLEDALRLRDRLLELRQQAGHRQSDVSTTSIEAAKRLGRLQAHLALIGRQ